MAHRDSEGSHFPVRLGDVHSPKWEWLVSMPLQVMNSYPFLRGGIPGFPVYSGCILALVCRHSSDGKGFTAERVGQQVWQGVYLVPLAFLGCLHDTGLKPPHILVDLLPN